MLRARYRGLLITRDRGCRPTDWHRDAAAARAEADRRAESVGAEAIHLETRRPGPLAAALTAVFLASVFVVLTHPAALPCGLDPFAGFFAFIHSFEIENRTEESLWFTPIGTPHGGGERRPLPIYLMRSPRVESDQLGDFHIAPGARRTLYYDWDDIDYSELVVRDQRGRRHQVTSPPTQSVITEFATLEPMSPAFEDAYQAAQIRGNRGWNPDRFERLQQWKRSLHIPAWITLCLSAAALFPAVWIWRRIIPIPDGAPVE